jgi:hypothetical protein
MTGRSPARTKSRPPAYFLPSASALPLLQAIILSFSQVMTSPPEPDEFVSIFIVGLRRIKVQTSSRWRYVRRPPLNVVLDLTCFEMVSARLLSNW